MVYRFFDSKFGHILLEFGCGLLWGVCAGMLLYLLSAFFPAESAVLGEAAANIFAFIIVVGIVAIMLWFMPRIYIFLVPIKFITIIVVFVACYEVFIQEIVSRWATEYYPVFSGNPSFVVACIAVIGVLIAGIPLLKKLYGFLIEQFRLKAEEVRFMCADESCIGNGQTGQVGEKQKGSIR